MRGKFALAVVASLALVACSAEQVDPTQPAITPIVTQEATPAETATETATETPSETTTHQSTPDDAPEDVVDDFEVTEHGEFNEPWSMDFLPGTDHLLIVEKGGQLQLRDQESGEVRQVSGTPGVKAGGQGGMHDVIAAPSFDTDGAVYLSWVRGADGGSQGVVGLANLDVENAALNNLQVIWEQLPTGGNGHFALRMVVRDDHLFVTSGDRQAMDPAQDERSNLGKVLRLNLDGSAAEGNPIGDSGEVMPQIWTLGHRNPLGIAVDSRGELWVSEMGPQGGDELNLLKEGLNYGWPEVSMGTHYDGTDIPDHADGDGFEPPKAYWVPAMSPGNLLIYQGDLFSGWQDSALLGGLSGQNLVRVELDGEQATPAAEWDMGERIRAVDEAPDGSIWLLEDGSGGRLLELRPS